MTNKPKADPASDAIEADRPKTPTKLALLLAELGRADGASLPELTAATGAVRLTRTYLRLAEVRL